MVVILVRALAVVVPVVMGIVVAVVRVVVVPLATPTYDAVIQRLTS